MLFFLGCHGGGPQSGDSTPPPGAPSDQWTVIESDACDAPTTAQWTLQDDTMPPERFAAIGDGDSIESGGIAVVDANGTSILGYVRPNGTAAAFDVEQGARHELPVGRLASGFSAGDLDDDGATDLIVLGLPATVFWDWSGDDAVTSQMSSEWSARLRDVAVGDVDGDRDLDLVSGYTSPGTDWHDLQGRFLQNEGGRVFSGGDPIDAPSDFWGKAFDVWLVDVNGDAAPDVSYCNDMGFQVEPNGVLHNTAGAFSVPADAHGLDVTARCMGSTWGDLDGDGFLDEFIGDSDRLWWLRGTADGVWVDATATLGIGAYAQGQMAWGVRIDDLDNDGNVELIVPTSAFREPGALPYAVYVYSAEGGVWTEHGADFGVPSAAAVRAVVTADVNADGVPDILLGDANRSPWVLLSDGCTPNAWVTVSAPEGALVTVESGGASRVSRVTTDGGYASASVRSAHFGLGAAPIIDRITVQPPWSTPFVLDGPVPVRSHVTFNPAE